MNDLFENLADNAESLQQAVKMSEKANEIADLAAVRLLERGETLGLLRSDEFQTAVSMANRQLISEIAVLHACGALDANTEHLSELWCNTVLPAMPSTQTSLLASNLKVLLEIVEGAWPTEVVAVFRTAVMQLVEVARRSESAMRLADVVDKVSMETADWAIDSFSQFAADRRASYRDVRLVLTKIITLIPSGPAGVNGHRFRAYLANMLLPNLPFNVSILRQVYDRAGRVLEAHASADDAKIMRGYLDEALPLFERHARLHAVAAHADRFAVSATERGYQVDPRHESLQRHWYQSRSSRRQVPR